MSPRSCLSPLQKPCLDLCPSGRLWIGIYKRLGRISMAESDHLSFFVFWLLASQKPLSFSSPLFSCALVFSFFFKDIMAAWTRQGFRCKFTVLPEIEKKYRLIQPVAGSILVGLGMVMEPGVWHRRSSWIFAYKFGWDDALQNGLQGTCKTHCRGTC